MEDKLRELYNKKKNRISKGAFGNSSPQPKKETGILDDLWEGAKDYVEGAKLGLAEIGRARDAVMGNIRPIANPLLEPEPGSPNFASYYVSQYQHVTKDAPVMNDEEQRIWNWYVGAGEQFRDGTLAPAAATVATIGAFPAVLAGAGIGVTGMAATAATTASLAYTPFMANDIAESLYEVGWGETAKNVGLDMIPGVASYRQETDPHFQEFAQLHPGQAMWHRATTFLDSFAAFAHPAGKVGRKVYDSSKEPLHKVVQEVQATHFMEALKEQKLFDTVKDLKKRVKEGKVRPQPPSKEEAIAHDIGIADELEMTRNQNNNFTNGGRRISIAPSTLSVPVRAKDIMNTLSSLASVRIGHLRDAGAGVLGYFEVFSEAIRVSGRLDFGVMCHELGHRLDKMFQIQGADVELEALYHQTWSPNTYQPHEYRSEGIAEFVREYLLNPTEAQRVCPEYFKSFEDVLAQNPALKSQLDLLGNQVRQWFNQSPEARVRGVIVFSDERTLKERMKGFKTKTKEALIDRYAHLKKMVEVVEGTIGSKLGDSADPYKKAKAMMSKTGAWVNLLLRKQYSDHHAAALEKLIGRNIFPYKTWWADVWAALEWKDFRTVPRLRNYMEQHGFKNPREAFTTYVTAKHTIEIFNEMERRGIQEADYNAPMTRADAEAVVRNTPQELVDVSMKLREFNANILALMEYFGFIDGATRQTLSRAYSDYVPFHRIFEIDERSGGRKETLQGDSASSILYELNEHGSDRAIKDPLFEYENMVRSIVARGMQNEVNRTIADLTCRVEGMSAFFHRVRDDAPVGNQELTFAVWRNGTREVYQATDPLLYDILKSEPPQQVKADMKLLQLTSAIFREGITSMLDFGIRTAVVDSFQAFVNSKSKKIVPLIPIVDNILGLYHKGTDKELKAEFEVTGVSHSTFSNSSRSHRDFIANQAGRKFLEGSPLDWAYKFLIRCHDGVLWMNQQLEESTRFQEYRRLRKQGMSMEAAAEAAREITVDFTQAGTTTRRWNKYIPFLNANVQSHRIFWNKLTGEDKWLARSRIGLLTLASAALWQMNHKEEWYQELDVDTRNRYWCFNMGDDMILKVPKPFDYGVPLSVLERLLDYYVDNKEDAPESLIPYIEGIVDINKVPPIANAIYECATNRNFFTERDIVPKNLQDASPENQWDTKTSYFARGLGGALGLPPMKIDHFIKQTFGTAAKTGLRLTDEMLTLGNTGRPEGDLSTNPFTLGLILDLTKNSESIRVYYENYGKMKTEYKDAELSEKNPKKPKTWRNMTKAKRKMDEIYEKMRNTEKSTEMSPHRKTAELKKCRKDLIKIAKEANEKYRQQTK